MKKFFTLLFIYAGIVAQAQNSSNYNPHSLKTHGYLRTGLGLSLPKGGEMVQFQLPETSAKARFGNEANHYVELKFNYKYQEQGSQESYEMIYMMINYLEYKSKKWVKSIRPETAQLYFKWNNIYDNTDIWVGKRYYQRLSLHLLDFYWLNPIQNADVGIGIEQIDAGNGQELDFALIRISDQLEHPADSKNLLIRYKLDTRLKKINLSENYNLSVLGQIGFRPEIEDTSYKSLFGYTLGAWTTYDKDFFYNRSSLIYRKGINMIENPHSGRSFLEIDSEGNRVYDMSKSYDIQFMSDIQYDNKSTFGFLGAISYLYKDFGIKTANNNNRTMHHINFTGRFSKYLGEHLRLTADSSYGYVDIADTTSGGLFKFTLAPELNWKKGMLSRPSIRTFVTYAKWSDNLKGQVGIFNDNEAYSNKTQGVTAGLQLEVWW